MVKQAPGANGSINTAVIPLLLAIAVLVTRWPFRTRYLHNWDAANFALGMRAFDVTQHQPHPPGYPLYVAAGVVLQPLFGDANAALVAVSILLEALAVSGLFLLGRAMFSTYAGLAAALLLLFSVTFWSYGELALAYPALAAFGTLTAYFAYCSFVRGRLQAIPCALAYGIGAGFRPDLALFLLPLLALACWRQPRRQQIAAGTVAAAVIALWLLPTMLLSGGPAAYLATSSAYFATDVVERYLPTAQGITALGVNIRDTAQYLWAALYATAAVLAGGLALLAWRLPRADERRAYVLLLAWLLPGGLFYLLLHVGDPGYVFTLLPPLLLLGVAGWWHWLSGRGEQLQMLAGLGLALVLFTNVLLFFLLIKPLTLAGLRAADIATGARVSYLQTYKPEEVLVLSYDSYKQLKYYLPQYPYLVWLDTTTPHQQEIPIPPGVKWAILTDTSVFMLAQPLPAEAELLPGDTWAAKLAVQSGQSLVYEQRRLQVVR